MCVDTAQKGVGSSLQERHSIDSWHSRVHFGFEADGTNLHITAVGETNELERVIPSVAAGRTPVPHIHKI